MRTDNHLRINVVVTCLLVVMFMLLIFIRLFDG